MNFRRINVEMVGDIAVAALPDHRVIDEENIQMLSSELNSLVEIEGRRKLIVDFCKIDYYSDAALGKLITLDKKL